MKRMTFLQGFGMVMAMSMAASMSYAQKSVQVRLATGVELALPAADAGKSLDRIQRQAAAGHYYWVAHTADREAFARAAGAGGSLQIEEKIGPGTYLIRSRVAPQPSQLKGWGIDAADLLLPEHKLEAQLLQGIIPGQARATDGRVILLAEAYRSLPPGQALQLLQQAGFTVAPTPASRLGVFQVTCAESELSALAALPFIGYVQALPPADRTLNHISRSISRSAMLQAPLALGGRNLSGAGITVGVGDDTDPSLHPDIADRIINHTPGIVNNHGAHTSGTVAGAGNIMPLRAGYAPRASLVSEWFSGIWQNAERYAADYGLVVTNNSYGSVVGDCGLAGVYDLQSKLLDEQAAALPQVLHVFASGNDGGNTCAPYPNSYATVLVGYQSAKNVITAGRSENAFVIGNSSSSGPVKDGRLKPEIIALGGNVTSLRGQFSIGNPYFSTTGTSMSAPAVAGGLALLYERYKQLSSNQNPSGALMKALLLNGARDMGTPGPDYRHGYGIMHLENSLRMLEAHTYSQRSIGQSGTQDTVISVPAGVSQLKVMLYWHDPAASPLAAQTLVNDLDLQVIGPNGTTLPLVLSAQPTEVTNAATPDTDRVNNSEQVVIPTPVPGNYTLRVRGYDVMVNAPQAYALVFDYVPSGLRVSVPFAGDSWATGTAIPVNWDFEGSGDNTFTLEYSPDDGNSWITVSNNIPAGDRFFSWTPAAGVASSSARLRLTRNITGQSFTTGAFTILGQPAHSLAAAAEQCEGYIKVNWTAVTGADGYQVLLKQGPSMQVVATLPAATLTHTLGGLSKDSTYYIAVRATLNGKAGLWNNALERRPNGGNCTGAISDGDLALDSITAPLSGRAFTSSAPGSNTSLKVRVKNLDDVNASAFNIRYSINGGAFQEVSVSQAVNAGATYEHTIPGLDLSAVGDYSLVAVVRNTAAADNNPKNDTFRMVVRHLANAPLSLASPFEDGFEALAEQTLQRNTTGLAGGTRWDYSKTDPYDRLRTRAQSNVMRSGQRAITLDVSKATPYATNPSNNLTGTFNLSGYTVSSDIRLDFWYQHHGPGQGSGAQNKVWARGSDTDPWIEVYDLGANQPAMPGVYRQTASLELADSLAAKGQQLSSSTQVRFGQRALYGMGDLTRFGGYSFDDFRLYQAVNDIQVLALESPAPAACVLTASTPISIRVRNSMNSAVTNIPVSYSINGGPAVQELIASIPGNSTITYTFTTTANLSAAGSYAIAVSASKENDNVPGNNSITVTVNNLPVVSSFPYFQNFEGGAASWYTGGTRSSWQLGTPAARLINRAASGSQAWKTNLSGYYNDYELSYLYSPCFDINSMSNPTLSFSMAYDIEDCRSVSAVCDASWVEYSYDGINWQKLGSAGTGTNWYDYATGNVWMKTNQHAWHVATVALPKQAGQIRLRFVMSSDDGTAREGVAIDDIHIYDNALPIFTGPANSGAVSQALAGNGFVSFAEGGRIIASVNPNGNNLGSTEVRAYFYAGTIRHNGFQYFSNRNITIKPASAITGSPVTVRFFFTDAEVNELRNATGCADCVNPANYTRVNVSQYSSADRSVEDGSLDNNTGGGDWKSVLNAGIKFVPYDVGYYAEFNVTGFSELYISDGNFDIALPMQWVRFDAVKEGSNNARLLWETANERQVLQYEPEVMSPGGSFRSLGVVGATNTHAAKYSFPDQRPGKSGTQLYRIRQVDYDGKVSYSETRALRFGSGNVSMRIFPNPASTEATVVVDAESAGTWQWKITDAAGRTVLQGKWQMAGAYDLWRLNTRPLPAGVYQLILQQGDTRLQQKLIRLAE